jgi:hypothetical protein
MIIRWILVYFFEIIPLSLCGKTTLQIVTRNKKHKNEGKKTALYIKEHIM